jgi:hypothetical protein
VARAGDRQQGFVRGELRATTGGRRRRLSSHRQRGMDQVDVSPVVVDDLSDGVDLRAQGGDSNRLHRHVARQRHIGGVGPKAL